MVIYHGEKAKNHKQIQTFDVSKKHHLRICQGKIPKFPESRCFFSARISCCIVATFALGHQHYPIVGGFNPFEKYWSNWIISLTRGENKKYLKPPCRLSYITKVATPKMKNYAQDSVKIKSFIPPQFLGARFKI